MQLLDLALARRLGVESHARVESSRCVPQKLLLPGVNLVWVDLVAQRQIGNRACSRKASKAIFAFMPASILRLVFLVTVRSVYHDGTVVFQLSRWS